MLDISPELLALGFIWYVAFLFSTTCHEAAHALAAKLGGDETAFVGRLVTGLPAALRSCSSIAKAARSAIWIGSEATATRWLVFLSPFLPFHTSIVRLMPQPSIFSSEAVSEISPPGSLGAGRIYCSIC